MPATALSPCLCLPVLECCPRFQFRRHLCAAHPGRWQGDGDWVAPGAPDTPNSVFVKLQGVSHTEQSSPRPRTHPCACTHTHTSSEKFPKQQLSAMCPELCFIQFCCFPLDQFTLKMLLAHRIDFMTHRLHTDKRWATA